MEAFGQVDETDNIKLSKSVTVRRYKEYENRRNRRAIADFIFERFHERYIASLTSSTSKHGFAIMAICCLMIEALESFHNGWKTTRGTLGGIKKSLLAFRQFFSRVHSFQPFQRFSDDFYECVRCGILHQGETTGGWKIHRKGDLFIHDSLTINASKFLKNMESYLASYQAELRRNNWDERIWKNLRTKMRFVIQNCNLPDQTKANINRGIRGNGECRRNPVL
jgi:hypothetical protein